MLMENLNQLKCNGCYRAATAMKIKLIFLAEKLCLIAFITVNIKELLYDSVGTSFLAFIVS